MTVELAALRAEMTADTAQFVRAVDAAGDAADRAGQAAADLGEKVEKTETKMKGGARGLETLKRQIDINHASSTKLAQGIEILNRTLGDGRNPQEHARLMALLHERYDEVGKAAKRAAAQEAEAAVSRARAAAKAAEETRLAHEREQKDLQGLRAKYDEGYAAVQRYNTALAELSRLQQSGALSGQSLTQAQARIEAEFNPANLAIAKQRAELQALAAEQAREVAQLSALRARYDENFAALVKYNTALAEVNKLEQAGALAGQSLANAKERIEQELNPLNVALNKERQQIDQLLAQLDPARAATARLAESEQLLTRALAAGTISGEEHTRMLRQLRTAAGDTSTGIQLAGHQLTNLSFQLQDAFVQLQMGTNPLTVLVQQGPQAVGAVGGVSNAVSLMGGALRSVMSPAGLAVAGVVALGAAAAIVASRVAQINSELRRTEATLKALNPTSGLTAEGVRQSSFIIAQQRDVSRADAASALGAALRNRNLGGGLATQVASVSQDVAAVLGTDVASAATRLSDAFSKGAAGVRELDRELGFLTVEQAASIRKMDEHGDRAGALALAMQALERRFGGAAASMKGEWAKAFSEMGKAWDAFVEWLAKTDLSKWMANLTQSAARGWKSIFSGDEDINAHITAMGRQLVEAEAALKRLQDAKIQGAGWVTDAQIQQMQDKVTRLREDQAAAIEQQRQIAAGLASGGAIQGPPIPPNYMTPDEQKRIKELRDALEAETNAVRGNIAQRAIRIAGIQAELAALENGAGKEARYQESLIAQERAMLQLQTASNDQLTLLALETKQTLELADAYQISKSAVVAQTAVNQAETAAITGQTVSEKALRQALLERAAAQAILQSGQQIASMRDEVRVNKELAAAALQGAAAEEEVSRANQVRLFSEQVLAAAVKSGRADMVTAAREEVRVYDELTKAAQEANRARQFNVAVRTQKEALEIQRKEVELLSATPDIRAREIAMLQATNQLKALGKDITSAEGKQYIENAGHLAQQAVQIQETQRVITEVTDNIVEGFANMAEGGKNAFEGLKDFAIAMLKEIAANAIIRPIIAPVIQSIMGSTMGGFRGGGVVGGFTGMAGSLASLGGTFPAAGAATVNFLNTPIWGSTSAGTEALIQRTGSTAAAYDSPANIAQGSGIAQSGPTWGQAAGGVGAGMVGGQVGSTVGNATKNRAVGAATGAVSGAAIGFMIGGGPVGAAVGAVIGGVMGAIGTAGKGSNMEGNATYSLASGRTAMGGQTGDKYSAENRSAAKQLAEGLGAVGQALGSYSGRDLNTALRIVVGSRDGLEASINGQKAKFDTGETGKLGKFVIGEFAKQLGDSLPQEIQSALARTDWSNLEEALNDINFGAEFKNSLKALGEDMGLVDAATAAAKAEVQQLTADMMGFRETALRLGLDTNAANDATRRYVEGLLGMRQVEAPLTDVEKAVAIARVRFAEIVPLLGALGINADEAAKALERTITAMRQDFIEGMDREFNSLSGREWVNQIDDAFTILDERMRNAAALGGGQEQALRNNHFAIKNIMDALSDEALGEAATRYGGDIAIMAQQIAEARRKVETAAPVINAAIFDMAGWMRQLSREANDVAGNGYLNQISDQFEKFNDQMAIAAQVGAGGPQILETNHRAIVNILSSLTDPQLNQAAAVFGGNVTLIAESIKASRAALGDAANAIAQDTFSVANWFRDLAREGLELSGAGYVTAITDQFARMHEQLGIAARVGAGAQDVLSNNHLSMMKIMEALTDAQLADAAARFGGGIALIADSMIKGRAAAAAAAAAQEAAAEAARVLAAAQEEAARRAEALAQERLGLERQVLTLTGNTAELRRRELAAMDASLRPLQQLIWGLEDAAAAEQTLERQRADALNAAQERVAAARSAANDAFQREIDTQNRLAEAAQAASDRMKGFAQGFRNLRQSLLTGEQSPLSPLDRYNAARTEFNQVAGRASAGDPEAMEKLEAASQNFLQQSRNYYASSATYAADFAMVTAALQRAETAASQQASAADQALAAAKQQTSLLQSQLDAINQTTSAVLTIPQALGELSAALLAQSQLGGTGGTPAPSPPADLITAAYRQFLGRDPEAGGYAFWQNHLQQGTSIGDVINGIANSEEAKARAASQSGTMAILTAANRNVPGGAGVQALTAATTHQTAALQDGLTRLIALTAQQTADIAELRAAQRRQVAA